MRWSSLWLTAVKPLLLFLIASLVPAWTIDYGATASSGTNSSKRETSATLIGSNTALLCATIAAVLILVLPGEARATEAKVEAETMTLPGTSAVVVHPKSTASGGQEVAFFSNGSARSAFDGAITNIQLRARGRACQGNPHLKVYVDDVLKGTVELTSATYADYQIALDDLSSGTHTLRISYENDFYVQSECDRNAFLDYYKLTISKVEAETMTLPSWPSVVVHSSSVASGGQDLAFYSNGSVRSTFDRAVTDITLRARGRACQGNPQLKVYVDNALKGTVEPTSTIFADYKVALDGLSSGTHNLRISYENDYYNSDCDRNAYLDYYVLTLSSGDPPPTSKDAVLVGAGKIAHCATSADEATAKLLDGIPGTVFTTGDNAYNSGTAAEFNDCYDPTWGRHKARTRPTPGHHDYATAGAFGYFGYFGAAAGDPTKGYYSYNLGEWHIIALNTILCGRVENTACETNSTMVSWLKQDLAANPRACTLAYFNHPLFSSGRHGNQTQVRPIWDALYAANTDVIINSRDHDYERFAPQDPSGTADPARGIREFVVGTGGAGLYSFDFGIIKPNSEVRNDEAYGVLKLTLHPTSYDWQFVPVAGKTFTDSGTTSCH